MYTLTDNEFKVQAEPWLRKVFTLNSLIVEPFMPDISARRLLHPCFGDLCEAIPMKILVNAATLVGDHSCYISLGARDKKGPFHCCVPLAELQEGYDGQPNSPTLIGVQLGMHVYQSHTTIFSDHGKWGIFLLGDGLAILGGVPEFVGVLQDEIPNFDTQVYEYLEFLKSLQEDDMILTIDWLPGLLRHLYDKRQMEDMLKVLRD